MSVAAERRPAVRQPVARIVTGQPDGPGIAPGPPAHYLDRAVGVARGGHPHARGSGAVRVQPGGLNRAATAGLANVRADALHKATGGLAARYETVVAEDLNVAGMTRNRGLARALAEQGFGIARRMLGCKTTWNGGCLLLAGRWFPSSKTCSGCGAVKAKLALSERTYRCGCGLVTGRDVNAAANLLKLAASGAESINACGGTVRPGLAGHVPVNQEPGAAHADQTGTASEKPWLRNRIPSGARVRAGQWGHEGAIGHGQAGPWPPRSPHQSSLFPSRAARAAACVRRCMPSLVSSADT